MHFFVLYAARHRHRPPPANAPEGKVCKSSCGARTVVLFINQGSSVAHQPLPPTTNQHQPPPSATNSSQHQPLSPTTITSQLSPSINNYHHPPPTTTKHSKLCITLITSAIVKYCEVIFMNDH